MATVVEAFQGVANGSSYTPPGVSGNTTTSKTALTGTTTLVANQSGITFTTDGFTAAGTITLPATAGFWGTVYGNASYAVTVAAASGNIVLPDGSSASTFVLPLSASSKIVYFFDGTNYRAWTGGREIIANAVNANEASTAGQIVGGIPSNGYANVTASRALGTTYTNSTGRPLFVSAFFTSGSSGAYSSINVAIGSVTIQGVTQASYSNYFSTIFIVPPGATYKLTSTGIVPTITFWGEY
jgi:hypothetical protein